MDQLGISKRFLSYIYERFNLVTYPLFILAIFFSAIALANVKFSLVFLLLPILLFLYFLRIRIYDDIKDYKIDVKLRPNRPLPRGLVNKRELLILTWILLIIELIIILILSLNLLIFYLLVVFFTLITYREFFIGNFLRKNILLYALPHVLIMSVISMYTYYAITYLSSMPFKLNIFILFGIITYLLGLFFEISRKMSGIYEKKHVKESFTVSLGFIPAWFLLISVFTLLISFLLFFKWSFLIFNYIPVFFLFLMLLFRPCLFKKLSQKRAEFLGGVLMLYILIIIILGGYYG